MLYAFVLALPTEDIIIKTLTGVGVLDHKIASLELMGNTEKIKWTSTNKALIIQLPKNLPGTNVNGFRIRTLNN